MNGRMGWVCPVCGAGNHPDNKLCAAGCHKVSQMLGQQSPIMSIGIPPLTSLSLILPEFFGLTNAS
jgi:hypothetical protein